MKDISSTVKEIKTINLSINDLLAAGKLRINRVNNTDFKDVKNIPVGIRPIYSMPEVCVCVGTFPIVGGTIDTHLHQGCREYFVVTKGKILLSIGETKRIVKARECAAVDEDELHSCESLEDDTEYIVISVPQDENISDLFRKVIAETVNQEV